jgi:low affinity Fe/Cu permease
MNPHDDNAANDNDKSLAQAQHEVIRDRARKDEPSGFKHRFQKWAQKTSAAVGTHWAFMIALLAIAIWGVTGPMFHYSNTWQLVINTGTTIVTFLMVFLIQNTQNRDAKAIHLKLDELIRSKHGARNKLVDLENCTDEELEEIEGEFKRIRRRAEQHPEHSEVVEAHAHR